MENSIQHRAYDYLFLILGMIGVVGFVLVHELVPHSRDVNSLWYYVFQIGVFCVLLVAVSLAPNKHRYRHILLYIPFLIYLGYITPRINYAYDHRSYADLYRLMYALLYPGLTFSICAAIRMGGSSPGACIKAGLTAVTILFSGYVDAMYFLVNDIAYSTEQGIPHVRLIIGHDPTYPELIIFALAHIPIIIGIHYLPFDKWISRITGKRIEDL